MLIIHLLSTINIFKSNMMIVSPEEFDYKGKYSRKQVMMPRLEYMSTDMGWGYALFEIQDTLQTAASPIT